MTEAQTKRGGPRSGAGRKRKSEADKMVKYQVRFEPAMLERIKERAEEEGLTVADFIRQAIIARI
ncbi:MAG: ribbon-helix-helix protein, CopG family [Mailhella sp.]|nr:ribbon-helix-helix protein, CopG family [Mailhella sp.]